LADPIGPMRAETIKVGYYETEFGNSDNVFTYRDRRLRSLALLRGLVTFYAICALGVVANVGIAGYVFSRNEVWWLAGLAGVAVGSVWNYAVSSVFTWKQK